MLVEESVEHAVEKQAGGRVQPPGKREMQSGHQFGDGPGTQDRERCEEKGNESPFAGVCAIAVHATPVRLSTWWIAPTIRSAAGKRRGKQLARWVEWFPEGTRGLEVKQLLDGQRS